MSEFSIIEQYFSVVGKQRDDVIVGVGDDAAILDSSSTESLAVSVDTLIESVHFPKSSHPYDIGWKSLAVNLSDMAAMGAIPRWITLAITLPEVDEIWLKAFSRGLSDLANRFNVQLIGGDTTRGSLSITIQVIGSLVGNLRLSRSNAQPKDGIYVTGFLGDAALGLKSLNQELPLSNTEKQELLIALNKPMPLVKEVLKLAPYINAAIDISDGLMADLSHILKASNVGGIVDVRSIPVSRNYRWCHQEEQFYDLALCGGDDYQICFTVSKENEDSLLEEANSLGLTCTHIGEIKQEPELILMNGNNKYTVRKKSYDHFPNLKV